MSSPPPLRHPVPTHPAQIPEPPLTPNSPSEYQRFTSSPTPSPANQPQQPYLHPASVPAYGYAQPPAPPQQFTSPFQHNNSQQPHYSEPQSVPHAHGPGQPPNLAAWGVNDVTTQLGMQFGSNAFNAGQEYVQKNVCNVVSTVKDQITYLCRLVCPAYGDTFAETALQRVQFLCPVQT